MKLPQVHFWRDRIDDQVIAVNAVRGWGDRPSNGVFMLAVCPRSKELSWYLPATIRDELSGRLQEREHILYHYYGRDWRNHLCDRIRDGVPVPA